MRPAACHVVPEVSRSRSRTTTSVQPMWARWYAAEQPMTPPPTITTRACEGTVMLRTQDTRHGASGSRRPNSLRDTCNACEASAVAESKTELGWRPQITDPDRRATINTVALEIGSAVEAWHREQPPQGDSHADYATLRIYAATDDPVPDPDDEAGRALTQAIAAIAHRPTPGLFGGAARVAFAVGH